MILVEPTARLRVAWLDAHAEWGPGRHEDGFGLLPSDQVGTEPGFAAWLARLADADDVTYRWIVSGERVLGGIAVRSGPEDYVTWAGHIGFGIRPSERRRGVAAQALIDVLPQARALGLDRVLLVCAADNVASARTIERAGGVFEEVQATQFGPARRYWVDCAG